MNVNLVGVSFQHVVLVGHAARVDQTQTYVLKKRTISSRLFIETYAEWWATS